MNSYLKAISSRQRGIVLIITLLVLVAMTLVSIAIVRNIDTAAFTVANYSFRSSGNASVMPPIERVIQALTLVHSNETEKVKLEHSNFPLATVSITDNNGSTHRVDGTYVAMYEEENDDDYGIPKALQIGDNSVPVAFTEEEGTANGRIGTHNVARVMVQRLCAIEGPYDPNNPDANPCLGSNRDGEAGDCVQANQACGLWSNSKAFKIAYRITVRVDGPNNSVSYGQAIINL